MVSNAHRSRRAGLFGSCLLAAVASLTMPAHAQAQTGQQQGFFLSAAVLAATEKRSVFAAIPADTFTSPDLSGTAATLGIGAGLKVGDRWDVRVETQWPREHSGRRVTEYSSPYASFRDETETTSRVSGANVLAGFQAAMIRRASLRLLVGIGFVSEHREEASTTTYVILLPGQVVPPLPELPPERLGISATQYGTAAALGAEVSVPLFGRVALVPSFRMRALSGLWQMDSGVAARVDF